jgi:hypothetical protein
MLVDAIIKFAQMRPGRHLGDYMERFWVKRPCPDKSCWSARVHHTLRSDHDRALHDHPWWNISIVLRGGYWEVMPGSFQKAHEVGHYYFEDMDSLIKTLPGNEVARYLRQHYAVRGVKWRGPGSIVFRKATDQHRLIVPSLMQGGAWSLFIMGEKSREWGFQTPDGWVHEDIYKAQLGREV